MKAIVIATGEIVEVEKTILRGIECYIQTIGEKIGSIYMEEDLIIVGLSEVSLEKEMDEHQKIVDEIMAIQGIEPIEAEMEEVWHCPEGYIFKDENGSEIHATKIVLEKKKKEYPKSFGECCKVLGTYSYHQSIVGYKNELFSALQKLLICRDAYWKIAGEDMGLGKPWEPDYNDLNNIMYGLYEELKYSILNPSQFVFPTSEMRNAFKENFKSEIEKCKELL